MGELKKSKLLTQLIEEAKKIGDETSGMLTAERFVVAVLKAVQDSAPLSSDAEMSALRDAVNSRIREVGAVKAMLTAHTCQRKAAFLDDLYMKKRMQEATKTAVSAGRQEVDSVALFLRIMEDPSEAIKDALERGKQAADGFGLPESAKPGAEPSAVDDAAMEEEMRKALEALVDSIMADEEEAEGEAADPEAAAAGQAVHAQDMKEEVKHLIAEVKRIRKELQSEVYGQDNAVNTFASGYFQANLMSMTDKKRKRPRATFLFAGPPGVGKTFLAEQAAQALKLPFKRFDMSEYADKEANIEFCGSDKVYKSAKAGNVTSFVAEHPKCVLLFDEIEKAHICVIHLFLQMLDAGRLRDNYTDEEVSFTDTIIILTTNAGKQMYEGSESGDFSGVSRKVIIKALQKDINPETKVPYFPGAICSRFASGNVVMFNHMGAHHLRSIAKREIERQAANFQAETGIRIQVDEHAYTALLFAEGSSADARTIRSRAEAFFNDELYELFRLIESDKVKTSISDIERIRVTVDLSRSQDGVSNLFVPTGRYKVLTFADEKTIALCREMGPDFTFIGVQSLEEAVTAAKEENVDLALLDMRCGAPAAMLDSLNAEDADSPARDFFKYLKERQSDLPVYLLESQSNTLGEEEEISFTRQGVRGVLRVEEGKDAFMAKLDGIGVSLYQQASMVKLTKANKLVSFETAQTVSGDGKEAEIKLFDFKTAVAVDAEDAKNVLSAVSKPNVRFDDVLGAQDAKQELKYFVEYLKDPKKYMGTGVKAPRGVLLYGPPGTGKTMLAKAMACEADVTFIAAEGNQFLKQYVGEGAEKVHELFRTARKYAPAILFVDEIDAIAKERRGGDQSHGVEETLTAFLTEMDGFASDSSKPVFVLAATNFDVEPGKDKSLDPALMRRFDRRVYIDLPRKEDRVKFLEKKMAESCALDISQTQINNIAMRSTGMSLAELDSVIELALRSAIRAGSTKVTDAILEEAFETFNGGEVKKWDASQLERVARHEAGHALLCWLSGETPSYLTIVARGNHGGYMRHADQEGKAIYTKDELLARIRTSLGGRAAEIVYYGERDGISTGASGDLASATNVAQQIVCTFGMDDAFGISVIHDQAAIHGAISAEVRQAVNRILQEQMGEAIKLISENKDKIDSLVEELMVKNHLNSAEIEQAITKKSDSGAVKITQAE